MWVYVLRLSHASVTMCPGIRVVSTTQHDNMKMVGIRHVPLRRRNHALVKPEFGFIFCTFSFSTLLPDKV